MARSKTHENLAPFRVVSCGFVDRLCCWCATLVRIDLAKALKALGYEITRQTGSHLRLTTMEEGEHHISIPRHNPMKIGTLAAILNDVAAHFQISRVEWLAKIKV